MRAGPPRAVPRLDAVSFQRGIDGPDPVGGESPFGRRATAREEIRRPSRSTRVATGTLACPRCDAPVALAGPVAPAAPLLCPFCAYDGAVRDFLSLAPPSRPARVAVRLVARRRLPGQS
jgi:hypothetical protein